MIYIDGNDFIGRTIESCSQYLAGEREQELDRARIEDLQRASGTHDLACDDDPLCWQCGEPESEHYGMQGWCSPYDPDHGRWDRRQFQPDPPEGEVWQAEAHDARGWTQAEREQYNELLDEDERMQWDEWLSKHCQQHDQELVSGQCSACISEQEQENRDDH